MKPNEAIRMVIYQAVREVVDSVDDLKTKEEVYLNVELEVWSAVYGKVYASINRDRVKPEFERVL